MGRRAISRLFRGNARRINTIKNLFSRKGDSIITENKDPGNKNMLANPNDTNDAQRLAIPKIYWSPELTDDELNASIIEVVPVYVVNSLKSSNSKDSTKPTIEIKSKEVLSTFIETIIDKFKLLDQGNGKNYISIVNGNNSIGNGSNVGFENQIQ